MCEKSEYWYAIFWLEKFNLFANRCCSTIIVVTEELEVPAIVSEKTCVCMSIEIHSFKIKEQKTTIFVWISTRIWNNMDFIAVHFLKLIFVVYLPNEINKNIFEQIEIVSNDRKFIWCQMKICVWVWIVEK